MYKPKKQLGQNFLSDKKVLMRIIDAAGIGKDDTVLEIGPGQGSMTYHLVQCAKKVIAVEKDVELVDYLKNKFGDLNGLEIVHADILEYLEKNTGPKEYKIVANIPYYLTSFLLRKIFELKNKPSEIVLMVQKEVAERLVAKKGEMNLLAISVQIFADVEILFYVSRNSFWPKPKVDSAVVKLKMYKVCKVENADDFMKIARAGFSAKRKVLVNNLAKGLGIPKEKICAIFSLLGIKINVRAQDLGIEEWIGIQNFYEKQK